MSFRSITEGLPGLLAACAPDPETRGRVVCRAWKWAVGNQVARRTRAISFADGVLTVQVLDPDWIPTLERMTAALRRRVNRSLGDELVRVLRWDRVGSPGFR